MSKTDIPILIGLLTFFMGSSAAVIAVLKWARLRIRDQDRREFEFNLIKDNQVSIMKTLERLEKETKRTSAQVNVQTQLSQALVRHNGDSVSGILGQKERGDTR